MTWLFVPLKVLEMALSVLRAENMPGLTAGLT